MKDKKLPEGVSDNPTESSTSGSFKMPDKPTRLNCEDTKGSIEKLFATNKQAFGGPIEPDASEESPMDAAMDREEAAKSKPDSDEDGKQ